MSSALQLSHAAAAKAAEAAEAALPAPVSSSTPSTAYSSLRRGGLREFLMTEVDPDLSTIPLAAYCFMTGWMSVSLSATVLSPSLTPYHLIVTWCPSPPYSFGVHSKLATRYRCVFVIFLTTRQRLDMSPVKSQLAVALARLFQGPPGHRDTSFHLPDKQALTSVMTFLFGAFLGRIGDRIGAKTRIWLFLGTIFQSLLTMGGAIALWQTHQGSVASDRAEPSWTKAGTYACLGLISASMGLQGIMGKRVNTQFATTSASLFSLLSSG